MHYDVFISYKRFSTPAALLVCNELERHHLNCYLDVKKDEAGHFDEKIRDAIEDAPNFLLILTKGSLDNCDKEDDWVRKEILIAKSCTPEKNIIPIRFPDFVWPKKIQHLLPEEIRSLESQQGVPVSYEYFPSTIEKAISYMKGIEDLKTRTADAPPRSASAFFQNALEGGNHTVDMAFHAGAEWHRNSDKVELIAALAEKKVPIRVLLNSTVVVGAVCSHMRQPRKKYIDFEECISDWLALAHDYPNTITVRVATVPLLHRLYIVRNGTEDGAVNVKYYSYGRYSSNKDSRDTFSANAPEYKLYTEEFDYIWEHASKEPNN